MQLLATIVLFYNHRSGGVPLEIYAYQNNEGRYVKVSISFFKKPTVALDACFWPKAKWNRGFLAASVFSYGGQRVGIWKVAD